MNEEARPSKRAEYATRGSAAACERVLRFVACGLAVPVAVLWWTDAEGTAERYGRGLDVEPDAEPPVFEAWVREAGHMVVVPDTRAEPRLASCPLVGGAPGLRFLAGIPLTSRDGETFGTLLVGDIRPREMSEQDREMLRDGAGLASDILRPFRDRICPTLDKTREAAGRTPYANLYEQIFNSIPAELALFDLEGRYVQVSAAAVRNPRVREWLIGKTPLEYWRERGTNLEVGLLRMEAVQQAARERRLVRFEESFTTRNGDVRHYVRIMSPLFDDLGNVLFVLGYGMDITDRKRYEQELVAAKERAEELVRLKDAFLANLSHEIRTPLTSVIGFASVLEGEIAPELSPHARLIKQGGERLLKTLETLLDLALLEADQVRVHNAPFDLAALVDELVAEVDGRIQVSGLRLEVHVSDVPLMVKTDRNLLTRILRMLLDNAIKFTDVGTITLRAEQEGGDVVLSVSDTGIGISPEFMPDLFEAFKQESTGIARTFEGSGLGLTVVKRMVDILGGSIAVESAKGEGSRFTVVIPQPAAD